MPVLMPTWRCSQSPDFPASLTSTFTTFNPMNNISADYKATLRSKIAVRADELHPGDSMDAVKERMTFTRKMYNMIMEEKNIDLF